jgi:cell division protein FtsX
LKECSTLVEKWIYFIKNVENLDFIPKEYENIKEFQLAFESAKIYNWNKEELEVYDYVSINEGKKKSEMETAISDAKKDKQIEIAKNLLDILDTKTIALKTGLTVKEVELLTDCRNKK